MSEILSKFNIFVDFPTDLTRNIKIFYASKYPLFGFCVLNDNKVFGFGEEIQKILANSKSNDNNNYVAFNELWNQNIQEFYEASECMFARNNNNEIFAWGKNTYGLIVGRSKTYEDEYFEPKKIDFFSGKNIIKISCGTGHCLGLTSDGLLYGWGNNEWGQVGCGKRDNNYILSPLEIEIEKENLREKIKFIHCAWSMTFAVSFNGNAYYWGYFGEHEEPIFVPKLINAVRNVEKFYDYYNKSRDYLFIILDTYGKVFLYNFKNEEINEIKREEEDEIKSDDEFGEFSDLYCDDYNLCLLQTEDCVYQLVEKELIKTEFYTFLEFYSKKEGNYKKTFEISKEGYLMTKEIQLNIKQRKKVLVLKNKNLFDQKYQNVFKEIKQIGEGGFGIVYKVEKKSDKTHYAIKVMEIKGDVDLNEIKIMSELDNNFVVQYIDSWIEEEEYSPTKIKRSLYIRMELCTHNLKEMIDLMYRKELIECVNYLHSLNPPIIHRDLKPVNILISDNLINGRLLKLCDFGLSKIHKKSSHSRMVGSLNYMAPEVLFSRKYNKLSDIFSLALIGTEIFGFEQNVQEIKKHVTREEFEKYLSKYLNTNLETKFKNLLDLISNCLLPKDYHSRPDCNQLLEKITQFSIDKNFVLNDCNSQSLFNNLEVLSKFGHRFFE